MPLTVCFIPEDSSYKPTARAVADLLELLLQNDYVDNEDALLDIEFKGGHHRQGASDTISVIDAAEVLEETDDEQLLDYTVDNMQGKPSVAELFENCDRKEISRTGVVAVRVFDRLYPIFDSQEHYTIRCSKCNAETPHDEWEYSGTAKCCPKCGACEELHMLDFFPKIEFARLIVEISDLVFTGTVPKLRQGQSFLSELGEVFQTEMKKVWYNM